MVVTELERRDVAVLVALGAVLVDALHAALEDGEVARDRVGGHVAATMRPFSPGQSSSTRASSGSMIGMLSRIG